MTMVEKEHGIDKARQLVKYQGATSLSRSEAMEILDVIWPEAPGPDKLAAAILCSSYGLNPLANHVFLINFKGKWARVWGIKAKRLVASRKGGYSYLDMTPRLMTDEEQIKVWGAVDAANLCYMTHLKDMKTGAEAYGYGKWAKKDQPYGTDKGNSQANMASIRSESQALDRLRPAEMPSGFVVTDEQYIEGEFKEVNTGTGEITEQTTDPSPEAPTSTSETTTLVAVAEETGEKTPEEDKQPIKVKRDPVTVKTIGDLRKALQDDFGIKAGQQLKELNLNDWNDLAISPAEAYIQVAASRQ